MHLHNDKDNFRKLLEEVSNSTGRTISVIEKDYYVTMILRLFSRKLINVVFKGGTSLSKGFHVINRFSEDIDITFDEHIGEARRKKLKNIVIKEISEEMNMPITNWYETQSDRDYNAYQFSYSSVVGVGDDYVPASVKVETALGSYAFPTEEVMITNYIGDYLEHIKRDDLVKKYELEKFEMKLQTLERTYIDKIFALCDYYIENRSKRCSRHMYDLYKLGPFVKMNNDFERLFSEVRKHRSKMDICPSAEDNIDISKMLHEICDNGFYKEDYETITYYFAEDNVSYDDAVNSIKSIANILKGFEVK